MGGGGSTYDYGFRIYNPAIARFLSIDPLFKGYPWYTPYQFAGNNPIWAIDLDGLEEKKVNNQPTPIKPLVSSEDMNKIMMEVQIRKQVVHSIASTLGAKIKLKQGFLSESERQKVIQDVVDKSIDIYVRYEKVPVYEEGQNQTSQVKAYKEIPVEIMVVPKGTTIPTDEDGNLILETGKWAATEYAKEKIMDNVTVIKQLVKINPYGRAAMTAYEVAENVFGGELGKGSSIQERKTMEVKDLAQETVLQLNVLADPDKYSLDAGLDEKTAIKGDNTVVEKKPQVNKIK